MVMILNLTQHVLTEEQRKQGVVEPVDKNSIRSLLTFETLPSPLEIRQKAVELANVAKKEGADNVMIGGAPFLMSSLEKELLKLNITPLYSFSKRESIDEIQLDGSVVKRAIFRHIGFVQSCI
jgi:hypothetical protein